VKGSALPDLTEGEKTMRNLYNFWLKLMIPCLMMTCIGTPALAATKATTEVLQPFNQASINKPDTFRQEWVKTYRGKPTFGLLNPYPSQAQKKTETKKIIAINFIAQKNKNWLGFVPTGVSNRLKALDFVTRTISLLPTSSDAALRTEATTCVEALLATKSQKTRKASQEARKILIGATLRLARELYTQDKHQAYDVKYWKARFKGNDAHTNTLATLAALAVFEITRKGTLASIYTDSGMKETVFLNFIKEIRGVIPGYGLATEIVLEVKGGDSAAEPLPSSKRQEGGKLAQSETPGEIPDSSSKEKKRKKGKVSSTLPLVLPPLFTGTPLTKATLLKFMSLSLSSVRRSSASKPTTVKTDYGSCDKDGTSGEQGDVVLTVNDGSVNGGDEALEPLLPVQPQSKAWCRKHLSQILCGLCFLGGGGTLLGLALTGHLKID